MTEQFNLKAEWDKTKKQLTALSRELTLMVKKGEKEAMKFSQKSKMQMDAAVSGLKLEKLYYVIGKEYVSLKDFTKPTQKLAGLIASAKKLSTEQKLIRKRLKTVK